MFIIHLLAPALDSIGHPDSNRDGHNNESVCEKYKIILQELKMELEIYQGKNNYLKVTPSFFEFWSKEQKKKKTLEYEKVYKITKK